MNICFKTASGIFILSIMVLFSCKTVENQKTTEIDKKDIAVKNEEVCKNLLRHTTKISNKGTRSERIDGYVYVNEYTIPDLFIFIQQKDNAYTFASNTKRFGKTGYHRIDVKTITGSDAEIGQEEIDRGWYLGSEKKKNTSSCWIYVQWNGGSAFIDSDKIQSIVENPPFNAIYPLSRLNVRFLN